MRYLNGSYWHPNVRCNFKYRTLSSHGPHTVQSQLWVTSLHQPPLLVLQAPVITQPLPRGLTWSACHTSGSQSPIPPLDACRGCICWPQALAWSPMASSQLWQVGPITTCATPDLYLQHLDKTLATYVQKTAETLITYI